MRIDASRAIKRLGIRHPIRFMNADLGSAHGAVHPYEPYTIRVNLRSFPCPCSTLEHTIAHELVHVRQMQDQGPERHADAYQYHNATVGYRRNPYELEAERLASELEHDIFVQA